MCRDGQFGDQRWKCGAWGRHTCSNSNSLLNACMQFVLLRDSLSTWSNLLRAPSTCKGGYMHASVSEHDSRPLSTLCWEVPPPHGMATILCARITPFLVVLAVAWGAAR